MQREARPGHDGWPPDSASSSPPRVFPARCVVEDTLSGDPRIALPAAVAHHAGTVLRLREGDPIVLFNGQGGEYRARLGAARGAAAGARQADVIGFDPIEREPSQHITLIQAQATADKTDR